MAKTVLVVDDEAMITTTLSTIIRVMAKCNVVASNNPEAALDIVEKEKVEMIVSDFMMPKMNGLEFLKAAKKRNPEAVTILLTGYADKENAIKSINEIGLYYYIEKPWDNSSLIKIIQNGLEKKQLDDELKKKVIELEDSNKEIARMYDLLKKDYQQETDNMQNLIISLANLIEAKDQYTDGHTRRVGNLCRKIGEKLGFSHERLQKLEMSGIIHDIGKVAVPDHILNKPGKLTDEEFEIIKKHTLQGEMVFRPLNSLKDCLDPIRHHHEKLNGMGYPDGLKGDEVSTEARIVAVADIFDALYTNRPYRYKLEMDKVRKIMYEEVDKGCLDGSLVDILFEIISSGDTEGIIDA
jgi:putative two-component system response regulator